MGDDYLVSPITGEKIPASKVQEHMRIGLLDPRWVEQRDKHVTDKVSVEKHTYKTFVFLEKILHSFIFFSR